jgi:hypothetical protein
MLSGFVVLSEGIDVLRLRAVAGGRRLSSDNLSFAKRTLVG